MATEQVFIAGTWRDAVATRTFTAQNPANGQQLHAVFPTSEWADCDAALDAAVLAANTLRSVSGEAIAAFLEAFAASIESHAEALVAIANLETIWLLGLTFPLPLVEAICGDQTALRPERLSE